MARGTFRATHEAVMHPEASAAPGDPFRLFVYGTLMRGGPRHHLLAGQRCLGEARTRPCYSLFDLADYPGLVYQEGGGASVRGELYEVEAQLLPALDEAEGAPALFRLGPVALEGEAAPTHAYFFCPCTAGLPRCRDDRWDNGGLLT
jgi:gamma-glutamylcyclotransferase (GGCT)/AIG2-like uncharacterized protein YtfP